jgi:hypothetical protein
MYCFRLLIAAGGSCPPPILVARLHLSRPVRSCSPSAGRDFGVVSLRAAASCAAGWALRQVGHEVPALVAGQVAISRLGIALRHPLSLGGGVFLLLVGARSRAGDEQDGNECSEPRVHGVLPCDGDLSMVTCRVRTRHARNLRRDRQSVNATISIQHAWATDRSRVANDTVAAGSATSWTDLISTTTGPRTSPSATCRGSRAPLRRSRGAPLPRPAL